MQRCELARECCECNMPFCPYAGEVMEDGLYPDEYEEDDDDGW